MKKVYLLLIAAVLPFFLFSQHTQINDSVNDNSFWLDASVGLCQPLGNYACSDLKNTDAGFAAPGTAFQLNFDWMGKNNFGPGVQYTFQSNPINSAVKNDTLPGFNQPVGSGTWSNHFLMAGLVFLKCINKIYIEGRGMAGFIISSGPLFRTMDPASHIVSKNAGTGYAAGIQAGVGYAISKNVHVKANIEYLYGKPGINKQYTGTPVPDTVTGNISSGVIKFETKKPISTFMINAGLVIRLSK